MVSVAVQHSSVSACGTQSFKQQNEETTAGLSRHWFSTQLRGSWLPVTVNCPFSLGKEDYPLHILDLSGTIMVNQVPIIFVCFCLPLSASLPSKK